MSQPPPTKENAMRPRVFPTLRTWVELASRIKIPEANYLNSLSLCSSSLEYWKGGAWRYLKSPHEPIAGHQSWHSGQAKTSGKNKGMPKGLSGLTTSSIRGIMPCGPRCPPIQYLD